jgi:hypothetical protein
MADMAIELSKNERSRAHASAVAEECLQMLGKYEQVNAEGDPATIVPAMSTSPDADLRIWDAKCLMALVYRYVGEHEKRRDLLRQTYEHHVQKLGTEHHQTKTVAYLLRLALLKCDEISEVLILQDHFQSSGKPLKLIPTEQLQKENIYLTADILTKIGVQ